MSRYPYTAPTGVPSGAFTASFRAKNARYIRLETSRSRWSVTGRAYWPDGSWTRSAPWW
jgi:hypothetical protein